MARTANASLVATLSRLVERETRSRGYEIASDRLVEIIEAGPLHIFTEIEDLDDIFDVTITRVADGLACSCSCLTDNVCEHMWGTLIEADKGGYLRGQDGKVPVRLIVVEAEDEEDDLGAEEDDDESDLDDDLDDDMDDDDLDNGDENVWEGSDGEWSQKKPRSHGLSKWSAELERIRSVLESSRESDSSWPAGRQIHYHVIADSNSASDRSLVVTVLSRDPKKNGELAKPKLLRLYNTECSMLPEPADRAILSMLFGAKESFGYNYYVGPMQFSIPGPLRVPLLRQICQTGRCTLAADGNNHESLTWDDRGEWNFLMSIVPDSDGKHYRMVPVLRRGEERVEVESEHCLLDEVVMIGSTAAPLNSFGGSWLRMVDQLKSLQVPLGQSGEFVSKLLAMPHPPHLEFPDELRLDEVLVPPIPCLNVRSDRGYHSAFPAALSFTYDGINIANDDSRSVIAQLDQKRFIRRDYSAESEAFKQLVPLGVQPVRRWVTDEYTLEISPKNLPRAVQQLTLAGWHIQSDGKLFRGAGNVRIEVTSGIDWFELHGSVSYGETTAKLPELLAALKKGHDSIELPDGTFGLLPEEWLKKYGILAGLGTADDGHLRFSRSQVGLLDALLASQPEARCDEVFLRARDRLKRFEGIERSEAPTGFMGELREYQQDGVAWMHFLREFGFGGCLADDMGLGKTVQVLALLESRRALRAQHAESSSPSEAGSNAPTHPSLVIVPKSLVFNWKQEASRFTPQLRVLDHTGGRQKGTGHFQDYDVVLTTYGTLRRDVLDFKDAQFDYVILDEAQAVKNADSASAKAVRLLSSNYRLALSGTPVENHLGELWSLFDFLNPGMLGASSVLRLGGAGARNPETETRQLLARALRPFILRRTKQQVAKDLPEKLEQTIFCELDAPQRKIYNELRDYYRSSILNRIERDGINKSKIHILEALLRLRQAACHPGLVDKARNDEPSAKLDFLVPQLAEVVDEGHKVLVFSQFTSLLAILRQRLDQERISYEYLDGKTRNRGAIVERFQTGSNNKVFLISLKAGGLGLNLTAAEYVYLLDPWWNPAVEAQAIDRTHRIGQTQRVFAYRLIARDTVEEKVLALQEVKRNLADAIINEDNSLIRDLGRDDLELLLS